MQLLNHFHKLSIHPKNAGELKELILQLAVQGKLTRHWREENPDVKGVSELLLRIQKEKLQLIKNKEIKKEKPLSPIKKDEIPYNLPESWVWKRLGEIVKLKSGTTFNKSLEEFAGDYMYVKVGAMNLPGNEVNITTSNLYVNAGFKIDKFLIPARSIIFPKRGGAIATNKKRIVLEPILIDLNTMAITSPSAFNFMYLKYWFDSIDLWDLNNGTSVPQINNKDIAPLLLSVPPLKEQIEIVRVIEILFKEVEQLETLTQERVQFKQDYVASALQQLANQNTQTAWQELTPHFSTFFDDVNNIKKLRETILQLAVQGKLTADWRTRHPELVSGSYHASELLKSIQKEKAQLVKEKKIKKEKALPPITPEEIPYELPKGWVWCRMQDVGLFQRGKSKHRPRNDSKLFRNGKYPLVQTGDVSNAKNNSGLIVTHRSSYNDFGLTQSKMWPKGTLCITIAANIAETGFLSYDACFPDSIVGFKSLIENAISKYVEFFISTAKTDLEKFAPSTAQKNINLGILYELIFPLPPLEEQKAIVEKVNVLMGLCDELEQEVQTGGQQLEDLMQSVLREIFEGKRS